VKWAANLKKKNESTETDALRIAWNANPLVHSTTDRMLSKKKKKKARAHEFIREKSDVGI
jgi:hypothetical protein